jgi:catechol 2,3-dioxygenase-like lactoylglutathione lyase family enzyme
MVEPTGDNGARRVRLPARLPANYRYAKYKPADGAMGLPLTEDRCLGHHERVDLDHVGLNVPDLTAAAAWYCANLDLEEEFSFALEGLDFAGVVLIHSSGWRLELINRAHARPGIQADHPNEAALTLGFSHFAVRVGDVEGAYARLITAGATHRLGPKLGPERDMPMAFVADPWGNLIEILTRTPSRKAVPQPSAVGAAATRRDR